MRLISSGTPSRTKDYVYPPRRLRLILISLAGGLAVAAALTVAVLGGKKTLATPGRLSSAHAPFDTQCAKCHAPAVVDVRCENCHDPFGSNQFRNAGHVWFGTKDPAQVRNAKAIDCATCHSDHRGRKFPMAEVDERDCARCHFATMARHPEFSIVKAGVMRDEGIRFTHDRHVAEVVKAGLDRCQFCHEPTADRHDFQPLSFDRHCARCHTKGGSVGATDPLPRRAVILPEDIDAPWAQKKVADTEKVGRANVVVDRLEHQDPWVIFNLWKIAREVDSSGLAAKRAGLVRKIDELRYQLRQPPTRGMSPAVLRREEQRLVGRVAALSRGASSSYERSRAERDLARIRVQIEVGPGQMTAPPGRDRRQIETDLAQRMEYLSYFDSVASPATPVPPEQREERFAALRAMTAPCVKCHLYDGPIMQSVNAAMPLLEHAKFNHLPHVQQKQCEECHTGIPKSKRAEQVNLPGVATCRECHHPGKTRDDCAECHFYHPPTEPWPPI
ncbi:MAG TPA: hypothetical protein VGQ75_11120 [Thermoanaerobaculia bacterium]|jgi:hypothetical protein|nr:hypothetical protein [Thermoanaerobaculia bacterium]HEV8609532.1 hypothetical protein [Thermoanaerobaculia bacterium]